MNVHPISIYPEPERVFHEARLRGEFSPALITIFTMVTIIKLLDQMKEEIRVVNLSLGCLIPPLLRQWSAFVAGSEQFGWLMQSIQEAKELTPSVTLLTTHDDEPYVMLSLHFIWANSRRENTSIHSHCFGIRVKDGSAYHDLPEPF